jgi:hypothetical protein
MLNIRPRRRDDATQEIPCAEWNNFFDGFSLQHEGWLATLEVFAPDVGAQEEAHELPLEGISIDSTDENSNSISINLGRSPADHVAHTINEPETCLAGTNIEGCRCGFGD